MHAILAEVCEKHRVTPMELRSRRRVKILSWARREFWYRCRLETPASYMEMGAFLGRFDHKTVIRAAKRHEARLKETTP